MDGPARPPHSSKSKSKNGTTSKQTISASSSQSFFFKTPDTNTSTVGTFLLVSSIWLFERNTFSQAKSPLRTAATTTTIKKLQLLLQPLENFQRDRRAPPALHSTSPTSRFWPLSNQAGTKRRKTMATTKTTMMIVFGFVPFVRWRMSTERRTWSVVTAAIDGFIGIALDCKSLHPKTNNGTVLRATKRSENEATLERRKNRHWIR